MMREAVKGLFAGKGGVRGRRWWGVVLLVCVLGLCGWLWGQAEVASEKAGDANGVVAEASEESTSSEAGGEPASEGQSEAASEAEASGEPSPWSEPVVEAAPRPTTEALKKLVVEKNIFRPGKVVFSAAPEVASAAADMGPQRLKKPFTVDAIVRDMGRPVVFLSFGETSKPKAAYEGDVFEEMVKIVSIEGSYIVCAYAGREVRIGTNESSDDGWRRLVGEQKDYVFGWAVLEEGKRVAAYVFEQGKASSPIKVHEGEHLGKAEVVKIEATRVHLRFADGSVDMIE